MEKIVLSTLYFGTQVVHLRPCEGDAVKFTFDDFHSDSSPEGRAKVDARKSPAAFLGDSYKHLALPAVPSYDYQRSASVTQCSMPTGLTLPLIKSNSKDATVTAVQSGRRSALLHVGGYWYRLKGCGNLYDGFNSQPVTDRPDLREIRGCMFEQTVSRELYMTELVNRLMKQHAIPVANKAVGWFAYSNTADGVANEYPAVKRFCGVLQTLGERRLADHVLSGLETLLPRLLPKADAKWIAAFPAKRLAGTADFVPTWMAVVTEAPVEEFVDMATVALELHLPPIPNDAKEQPVLAAAWEQAITQLQQHKVSHLLGLAYWRLGREVGTVIRLFAENNISWGTYSDLLGTHCNAHPNNLVVVRAEHSQSHLLAPLDFDMAFTRETYVGTQESFDELMRMESNAMCTAMAGDHLLNSGVRAIANLSQEYEALKWALRDTVVRGYMTAVRNTADEHPISQEQLSAIRSLIELAMVTTAAHIS